MCAEYLARVIFGFLPAQLAYVMARLRTACLTTDGPMSIDELSSATNTRRGPDESTRSVYAHAWRDWQR